MIAQLHVLNLPTFLVGLWRGVLFILVAILLACAVAFMRSNYQPMSRRLLMGALSLFMLRYAIVNIERFNDRIYWESLPMDTLAILVSAVGIIRWIREREEIIEQAKK